jgi:hexaprenyl-diphosphate synthase
VHTIFGNKLAVLGGDFLLGRSSSALSRLDESEVVELIASVISNVVEGDFWGNKHDKDADVTSSAAWDAYTRMSYLKTASLMAKAARATVVLGGCKDGEPWKDVAYVYGRNLGLAFQVR